MADADNEKVRAVLDRFEKGWRKADISLLKSLWDPRYPNSSYIASEREGPVFGPEAIDKYYEEALALFPITSMKIDHVKIDVFEPLAYAFCDISIGFKVKNTEHVVHPRATFVLRKWDGEWYLIHYHESIQYEVPGG